MSKSKRVIQPTRPRDRSRVAVSPPNYTQLQMTSLATVEHDIPAQSSGNRLAVPVAGRPFTTAAASWNGAVLRAQGLVAGTIVSAACDGPLGQPGPLSLGGVRVSAIERASWRLVASWLTAVATGAISPEASLADAEQWLTGGVDLSRRLPRLTAEEARSELAEIVTRRGLVEMLPYALDPTPHAYRRDVLKDTSARSARRERKQRGSFFTPADVAEHIVELVLNQATPGRVLDPACGTGVFLRCAFERLVRGGADRDEAVASLHGVDIDERCVDMTAFVLLVDWLRAGGDLQTTSPIAKWQEIRDRLACADTLLVFDGVKDVESLMALELDSARPGWARDPFDVIVGNPPYAAVGGRSDAKELGDRFGTLVGCTPSTDIYAAFVELLCSQLTDHGAGALVVPMSIAYGSGQSLSRLRQTAEAVGGRWAFEFFDRTPDALFGDDVKQRTAIVTHAAGSNLEIVTSPVMRWTSRNRSELFDRIPQIKLADPSIATGVPKLGTELQARSLVELRERPGGLADGIRSSRRAVPPVDGGSAAIYVAGTAYNWLTVYRTGAAITAGVENPSQSGVLELTFADTIQADAAYAVLTSRLAYWLWKVDGDAFHVPTSWVARIPISLQALDPIRVDKLARLGSALWSSISERPIASLNGGRSTISFCPHSEPHLLDQIDGELIAALGLPAGLQIELVTLVDELTRAGRDSLNEHGLRRALAAWTQP